jgi:hypothetical protein
MTKKIIPAFIALIMCSGSLAAEEMILVATDKTYKESQEWVNFWAVREIQIRHVLPLEFNETDNGKHVVLMGSFDESEGIAEIAKEILSKTELANAKEKGIGKTYIKSIVPKDVPPSMMWQATKNYIVFIGADLSSMKNARQESRDEWVNEISLWFDIDETPRLPAY